MKIWQKDTVVRGISALLYAASLLDPRFKALPFLAKEDQLEVRENIVGDAAAFEVILVLKQYIFL